MRKKGIMKEQVKIFFKGEISKRTLTYRLLPFTIGGFSVFLIIARVLFPHDLAYPYSWTTSTISRLGIPHQNPIGWFFFCAAFIWLGVFFLPLVSYMYSRFSNINKLGAKLMAILILASCISDILLGAIPNISPKFFRIMHGLNAVIAFQGILLMALLSFILMVYHEKRGKSTFSRRYLLVYLITLLYGITCSLLVLIFMEQNIEGYYTYVPGTPILASSPFWEWQGFIILLCLMTILCFIVPEKIE